MVPEVPRQSARRARLRARPDRNEPGPKNALLLFLSRATNPAIVDATGEAPGGLVLDGDLAIPAGRYEGGAFGPLPLVPDDRPGTPSQNEGSEDEERNESRGHEGSSTRS